MAPSFLQTGMTQPAWKEEAPEGAFKSRCSSTSDVSLHPLKADRITCTVIAASSAVTNFVALYTWATRTFDEARRQFITAPLFSTAVVPVMPFVLWLVELLGAWRALMRRKVLIGLR
jgi:hypothetical protein